MTTLPPSSQLPAPEVEGGAVFHRVGTLVYDRRALVGLFAWLLWGDFAFNLFESIFGRFMPLYLKDLGASNTLIGVVTGSLSGIVNVAFLPHLARWSDAFRSRLGRRIPFLLATTPLAVLSLGLVGFTPEIGGVVWAHLPAFARGGLTEHGFTLGLLCLFVVVYHSSNLVMVNSFSWLLRDVVPPTVMARFFSWFRVVGMAGMVLFLWCVFPKMLAHRKEVFAGIGAFYLLSFLLMCRNVREGEYDFAPKERTERRVGLLGLYASYIRNCFSVPLYRNFILGQILVMVGTSCANSFLTIYARNTLGLDMGEVGRIFAWSAVAQAAVYAPMAWVCSRVAPLRVALAGLAGLVLGSALAYARVIDRDSWLVYQVLFAVPTVAWTLGIMVFGIQLFPARDYAQLSSALNVFGCGGLIFGNYIIGQMMDASGSRYALAFLWTSGLLGLSLLPFIRMYRGWLRHGGPAAYVPPELP